METKALVPALVIGSEKSLSRSRKKGQDLWMNLLTRGVYQAIPTRFPSIRADGSSTTVEMSSVTLL